jgi:small subunit ribosomal protein S16
MLRIRLRRVGAPKKPNYRVIVADVRSPRDGAFLEIIGHFNPLTNPESVSIDTEKAEKWLKLGAKPSKTASRLLNKIGILQNPNPVKETPS